MRDTTDGAPSRGVYAIASGKGGVGKTTVTANLAAAIAELGYDVAAVDADLGMANLDTFLGVDPDEATLAAVLAGIASVADATYSVDDRLAVVPGGTDLDTYARTDTDGLRTVVARLRERFAYVFLDVGAGISYETVLPLEVVDGVILVTTADPAALENLRATRAVVDRRGARPVGLVLNRHREESRPENVVSGSGLDLLGTIPEDELLGAALGDGRPVVDSAPGSPVAGAFRRLAGQFVGTDHTVGSSTGLPPSDQKTTDPTGVETSAADGTAPSRESAESTPSAEAPLDQSDVQSAASEEEPPAAKDPESDDTDSGGLFAWLWR